jgi:hypothetical protein
MLKIVACMLRNYAAAAAAALRGGSRHCCIVLQPPVMRCTASAAAALHGGSSRCKALKHGAATGIDEQLKFEVCTCGDGDVDDVQ